MKTKIENDQPAALYLLFFVQMWECFSYYGMRILLVLYMTQVLDFTDTKAFGVFATYCALVEFGGIFGGRLADRYLGQRYAIFAGGWLIFLGHAMMMFSMREDILYLSLSSIAVGTGLFSTNISSLLSLFYGEEDPRRERGYTLFYIGINVGAILATACVGTVGDLFGWHAGFGLAALGMLLANLSLLLFSKNLEGKGSRSTPLSLKTQTSFFAGVPVVVSLLAFSIYMEEWMMHLLPVVCLASVGYAGWLIYTSRSMSMRNIASLGGCLIVLSIFFAAEELTGGALLLFTERVGSGSLFGISIPSSMVMGINPVVIITLGMGVSKFLERFQLSTPARLLLGCMFAAIAFGILSSLAHFKEVPVVTIMACIFILSLGELLIGPVVYAYFAEIAPQNLQGVVMGLIPIGYSLASVIAGFLNQTMALDSEEASLELYASGFANMSYLLLALVLGIYLISNFINSKEKVIYENS